MSGIRPEPVGIAFASDRHDKTENLAALPLADLVVRPIGRHVLGKAMKEDFEIVKPKFRRNRRGEYTMKPRPPKS